MKNINLKNKLNAGTTPRNAVINKCRRKPGQKKEDLLGEVRFRSSKKCVRCKARESGRDYSRGLDSNHDILTSQAEHLLSNAVAGADAGSSTPPFDIPDFWTRFETQANRFDSSLRTRKGVQDDNPAFRVPSLFRMHADQAFHEDLRGRPLASAEVFGKAMQRRGFYPDLTDWKIVDDHLGKRGLDLPGIIYKGVRRYDISALNTTIREKRRRERKLHEMPLHSLKPLIAESTD